jgi:hypothetical protein
VLSVSVRGMHRVVRVINAPPLPSILHFSRVVEFYQGCIV